MDSSELLVGLVRHLISAHGGRVHQPFILISSGFAQVTKMHE